MNRISVCKSVISAYNQYSFFRRSYQSFGESIESKVSNIGLNKKFSTYPTIVQKKILIKFIYDNMIKKKLLSIEKVKQVFMSKNYLITNDDIKKIVSAKKFQQFFHCIKGNKSSYISLTDLAEKEACSSTGLFDQSIQIKKQNHHYQMNTKEILLLYLWKTSSKKNQPVRLNKLTEICRSNGHLTTNNKLKKIISSKSFRIFFHILECHKNKVYVKLTEFGEEKADLLASNTISQEKLCLEQIPKQDVVTQNINNHSIYKAFSKKTGQPLYIGRTNNIDRRRAEHLMQNNRLIFQIKELTNLTLKEARVVEQALINLYGLKKNNGILENSINSIKKGGFPKSS